MKSNELRRALVCALALSCVSGLAMGQFVTLSPSADTTLYEEPDTANGGGQHLFAGRTAGGLTRRGLVRFDVAAVLNGGEALEYVTLNLVLDRTISSPTSLSIHRVTQSWGEGTADAPMEEGGGAPAGVGDATWQDRFRPTDAWTNAGGDFVAVPSATTSTGGLGLVSFSGSAAMIADVQSWIDDPSSNHGWILIGDEASAFSAKRFGSRDGEVADVPTLIVGFSPPPIPTLSPLGLSICCLLVGAAGLWLARRV